MDSLAALWPSIAATGQVVLAAAVSAHVVLRKRDVSSAIGWIGLIWLVPVLGSVLYGLFGINRITRRATGLRAVRGPKASPQAPSATPPYLIAATGHLDGLARLLDRVVEQPLLGGNRITALFSGHEAYQAMLDAIAGARHSVGLSAYIFDNDAIGDAFVAALSAACGRGVAVRVLVDDVGTRYSMPPITHQLRRRGVPMAEFLPTLVPVYLHYANLRNHRKLLIVDGRIGFTGGMNIRRGHCDPDPVNGIQDLHFRIEGPVVGHLAEAFVEDWSFAQDEQLAGEVWFPTLDPQGSVLARGIAAGPDESFERIRWAMLGALSQARERLRIITPYFLPDVVLSQAVRLAALRGVAVDIIMPERSNLRLVQWASRAKIAQFLARGCRVWLSPPPFDHTKLLTVDRAWALVGSANWDQRSLRLNFEFDLECYDRALVDALDALADSKIAQSRPLTLAEVNDRPFAAKLRDGTAWLLSPYL